MDWPILSIRNWQKRLNWLTIKVHIISTHQPMYLRMSISSCTGIAAYLRTKQCLLNDRTSLLWIIKQRTPFLIDKAVPNTHNLAKTIIDKQNKYHEMVNAICAMWKQKAAQVIPIAISYTAVIPKSPSQSLTTLNLHPNTYMQMQKSVILGISSNVRNFLNYK